MPCSSLAAPCMLCVEQHLHPSPATRTTQQCSVTLAPTTPCFPRMSSMCLLHLTTSHAARRTTCADTLSTSASPRRPSTTEPRAHDSIIHTVDSPHPHTSTLPYALLTAVVAAPLGAESASVRLWSRGEGGARACQCSICVHPAPSILTAMIESVFGWCCECEVSEFEVFSEAEEDAMMVWGAQNEETNADAKKSSRVGRHCRADSHSASCVVQGSSARRPAVFTIQHSRTTMDTYGCQDLVE